MSFQTPPVFANKTQQQYRSLLGMAHLLVHASRPSRLLNLFLEKARQRRQGPARVALFYPLYTRPHTQTCTCSCVKFRMGVRGKFSMSVKVRECASAARQIPGNPVSYNSYEGLKVSAPYLNNHILICIILR